MQSTSIGLCKLPHKRLYNRCRREPKLAKAKLEVEKVFLLLPIPLTCIPRGLCTHMHNVRNNTTITIRAMHLVTSTAREIERRPPRSTWTLGHDHPFWLFPYQASVTLHDPVSPITDANENRGALTNLSQVAAVVNRVKRRQKIERMLVAS